MNNARITPVILSGGAGTRLWPLSRSAMPKQMLRLTGDESLIQSAARRAPTSEGFAAPVIVAGRTHRALIERQMHEIGVAPRVLILEPAGRNTAPAIALAAMELPDETLMLVMPSDQVIVDVAAFRTAVTAAAPLADEGWLVTFGITPDRPETGYGYIQAAEVLAHGVRRVERFVEKPDAATARDYVASGEYFWNAGIFLIRASAYLDALSEHAPEIEAAVRRSFVGASRNGAVVSPDRDAFLAAPSDSIDYSVMERAARVAVAPVDMGWSDIGAFSALWQQSARDADGNAVHGDVLVHDSRDCLLRSDGPVVAAVGVANLSVIATSDAVLVVGHDSAQDVKHIAEALKRAGRDAVNLPVSVDEAWGRRRRLVGDAEIEVHLYELSQGAAAAIELAGNGYATLCSGSAELNGDPLVAGMPRQFSQGTARLSSTAGAAAKVLVTISGKADETG